MGVRLKFNLVLIIVSLLGLAGSGWYMYRFLEHKTLDEVSYHSRLLMDTAILVRQYTAQQIKPRLDPLQAETFQPQAVPAFAARETLNALQVKYPGYSYREATLNPTNRVNLATDWERRIVEGFRSGALKDEATGVITDSVGNKRLYFARPIQIRQGECLSCHSTPGAAPASMLKIYGEKGGFGWNFDEIVSAQIVTVPLELPMQKAHATFTTVMMLLTLFFLAMFVALNVMLSRLVLKPITNANAQLELLASRDVLTGTANRRKLFETLAQSVALAGRPARGFSLLIFDLDWFKAINDTFGHEAGDRVLRNTAERVAAVIRANDFLARFGGEEFVVILPETGLQGALALAEKIRQCVADIPFDGVGQVTCSIGVAEWQPGEDQNALLKRADVALYEAKDGGRNRVVAARV